MVIKVDGMIGEDRKPGKRGKNKCKWGCFVRREAP